MGGVRRERLDRLLTLRGHARSRERAQALILAGVVRVDGRRTAKAGSLVPVDAEVTIVSVLAPRLTIDEELAIAAEEEEVEEIEGEEPAEGAADEEAPAEAEGGDGESKDESS